MQPPAILLSSRGRGWHSVDVDLVRVPAGRAVVAAQASHRVSLHVGPPVGANCRCDGPRHRYLQSHGDTTILPAGVDGEWEDDGACTLLHITLNPALVRRAAQDLRLNPETVAIRPRLHIRDARIEHIAWALKAELESESVSDRLYAESLGLALAIRLLDGTTTRASSLSPRQRRRVLDFIESNLTRELSLLEIATVADISVSHLKTVFRQALGMPVHQYVIHRRVERAKALLLAGTMPASQVAVETGFAHQSHMAYCMRRVLGVTPRALVRMHH
jgi:AraC family transcriptional regulator